MPSGLVKAAPPILAEAHSRRAAIIDELRRVDAGELPMYPADRLRAMGLC